MNNFRDFWINPSETRNKLFSYTVFCAMEWYRYLLFVMSCMLKPSRIENRINRFSWCLTPLQNRDSSESKVILYSQFSKTNETISKYLLLHISSWEQGVKRDESFVAYIFLTQILFWNECLLYINIFAAVYLYISK